MNISLIENHYSIYNIIDIIRNFIINRNKACKKELRQKIQFALNQTPGDSAHMGGTNNSTPISAASNNPPNISGAVGGMNPGAQGGMGNASNLHHPPPAL